ncbi:hypothetical protein HAV15_003379 [Penicillium sp. str. |nr:hypothetical protein HAV15_003379 [Penicillium sp. str. \
MINRVLLGDAKPGSVSNPILIDIDIHGTSGGQDTSEQDDSDGDTVRLSTPDFYEILRDGGTTGSQKKSALTNSPPVVTPSKFLNQQLAPITKEKDLNSRGLLKHPVARLASPDPAKVPYRERQSTSALSTRLHLSQKKA